MECMDAWLCERTTLPYGHYKPRNMLKPLFTTAMGSKYLLMVTSLEIRYRALQVNELNADDRLVISISIRSYAKTCFLLVSQNGPQCPLN